MENKILKQTNKFDLYPIKSSRFRDKQFQDKQIQTNFDKLDIQIQTNFNKIRKLKKNVKLNTLPGIEGNNPIYILQQLSEQQDEYQIKLKTDVQKDAQISEWYNIQMEDIYQINQKNNDKFQFYQTVINKNAKMKSPKKSDFKRIIPDLKKLNDKYKQENILKQDNSIYNSVKHWIKSNHSSKSLLNLSNTDSYYLFKNNQGQQLNQNTNSSNNKQELQLNKNTDSKQIKKQDTLNLFNYINNKYLYKQKPLDSSQQNISNINFKNLNELNDISLNNIQFSSQKFFYDSKFSSNLKQNLNKINKKDLLKKKYSLQ